MKIKLLSELDNTNAIDCIGGGGGGEWHEWTVMNF
jgi:hypothetical protein